MHDQLGLQTLAPTSKYSPSLQLLHWTVSRSKYCGRQQAMQALPFQKGASSVQVHALEVLSYCLLLGQVRQVLVRGSQYWLEWQATHFSPSKKGWSSGQGVQARTSRSQTLPRGQERHCLRSKSKYCGRKQGTQALSSQKQLFWHSQTRLALLQVCPSGQVSQVLLWMLKQAGATQAEHLLPSKQGVAAGQSTHCLEVRSQICLLGQKTQADCERSKYLGAQHSMQLLLFQQSFSGHWQVSSTTIMPPLQVSQFLDWGFQMEAVGQGAHQLPSKQGVAWGQGTQDLSLRLQIWLLVQILHLRSVQSKQCGWQHSVQRVPLKKRESSTHSHRSFLGLQARPTLQRSQRKVVRLQKVPDSHSVHRCPLRKGFSGGQRVQACQLRSQRVWAGQEEHCLVSKSKYLGRQHSMHSLSVKNGFSEGHSQLFFSFTQFRPPEHSWHPSIEMLKYSFVGQASQRSPLKTGLSTGHRTQDCWLGSQRKFFWQDLQVLSWKSKYLGRQQATQVVLPSKGLEGGQTHRLAVASNSFPFQQSVHCLVLRSKYLGGGQAMQRVGETWQGLFWLHSQALVCGLKAAPLKQSWQVRVEVFQYFSPGHLSQFLPLKKGKSGGQASHIMVLILQLCLSGQPTQERFLKSQNLGWTHWRQVLLFQKQASFSKQSQACEEALNLPPGPQMMQLASCSLQKQPSWHWLQVPLQSYWRSLGQVQLVCLASRILPAGHWIFSHCLLVALQAVPLAHSTQARLLVSKQLGAGQAMHSPADRYGFCCGHTHEEEFASAMEPFRQSHLPVDALNLPGDTQGAAEGAVVLVLATGWAVGDVVLDGEASWCRRRGQTARRSRERINSLKLICFEYALNNLYSLMQQGDTDPRIWRGDWREGIAKWDIRLRRWSAGILI